MMIDSPLLIWLLTGIAGGLAAGLIVVENFRRHVAFLGLLYLICGILLAAHVPLLIAVGKFVAGIVAVLILAATMGRLHLWDMRPAHGMISGRAFRVLATGLVLLAAWGMHRSGWVTFLELADPISLAGHWLLMLGVLNVGLSREPLRVGVGLLTMFLGFDVVFTFVEPSLAVQALLAAVHLSIAFLTSYVLTVRGRSESRVTVG